jgi:hypothetical protein
MSDELKVTKDRVLKTAESCGEAKRVLQQLFPEAFETPFETFEGFPEYANRNNVYIARRGCGNLAKQSLHLGYRFVWSVETDSEGYQCLRARRK